MIEDKERAALLVTTLDIAVDRLNEISDKTAALNILEQLYYLTKSQIEQEVPLGSICFDYFEIDRQIHKKKSREESQAALKNGMKDLKNLFSENWTLFSTNEFRLELKEKIISKKKHFYFDLVESDISIVNENRDSDSVVPCVEYQVVNSPIVGALVNRLIISFSSKSKPIALYVFWWILFGISLVYLISNFNYSSLGLMFITLLIFVISFPVYQTLVRSIDSPPFWSRSGYISNCFLVTKTKKDGIKNDIEVHQLTYEGICPVCNGHILIGRGKHTHKGRWVGKCSRSPDHLYSFDHVTLRGIPIQQFYWQPIVKEQST